MPVSSHCMMVWGAWGTWGVVLLELRGMGECSLHGWGANTDALASAKHPEAKRKWWKMEKRRATWWPDCAKVIRNMLFFYKLDYLTSSVSKGTGTPRQERVCALKSSSVPRIAKWKYSNRLLVMLIFIQLILTLCAFKLCALIIIYNTLLSRSSSN